MKRLGDSPSGKAAGSGPAIRGFESLIPSQENLTQEKTRKCGAFSKDTKEMKTLELALVFFIS